jgi:hypothetical protein
MVAKVEQGRPASVVGYARLGDALGLTPRFSFQSERSSWTQRDRDAVHSAMAEVEAQVLRARGHDVLIDEPYQHYKFAGRADVVAINRPRRALLHLENRTRFPDIQEFAGAFNAKRAYLAPELARRHGLSRFDTVTHVVVALWSSEVLHVVRRKLATFGSLCPDAPDAFGAWWSGEPPRGAATTFVLLDPGTAIDSRRRAWVGLQHVPIVRPRYRGYAEALAELRAIGLA